MEKAKYLSPSLYTQKKNQNGKSFLRECTLKYAKNNSKTSVENTSIKIQNHFLENLDIIISIEFNKKNILLIPSTPNNQ